MADCGQRNLIILGVKTACGQISLLRNVKGFFFEDGYCVVRRLTPRGESECYYHSNQIELGVIP